MYLSIYSIDTGDVISEKKTVNLESPVKMEKSPTKKVPKRKRILNSDSEDDDNKGMKGEYERADPDYDPVGEKYKSKKISKSNAVDDKLKEAFKHTTQNSDIETTSPLKDEKELDVNFKKIAKPEISKSPGKDKEKQRTDARMENGHDKSKQEKYKSSSHHHKDIHTAKRIKEKEEKQKHKEKHRHSPHKKYSSVLLSSSASKRDSELSFKLSNTIKKDTSISSLTSTKSNDVMTANDNSSTEAIKKMLCGEKHLQLEPKPQPKLINATQKHLSKEKSVSHERKNANKLFPRPPRQHSSDTEIRKHQIQHNSGYIQRNQNNEPQGKNRGLEIDKSLQQQKNLNHKPKENHNLLGCIMTEMEKKN